MTRPQSMMTCPSQCPLIGNFYPCPKECNWEYCAIADLLENIKMKKESNHDNNG
jgi:hypothetical protein